MAAPPSPAPSGNNPVDQIIGNIERRLSRGTKIFIGMASIVTSIAGGAGVIYTIDNRYIHSDAYAADLRATNTRLDRSDLRSLEGQSRTVRGQIFDLERQKTGLTNREIEFLKQLKEDEIRLNREIEDVRRIIQRDGQQTRSSR